MVGDSVSTAFSLKRDEQLKEAIKYLSNDALFKKTISGPGKRPQTTRPKQKRK